VSALLVYVAAQLGISRFELAHIEAALRFRRDRFARAPRRDTAQELHEAYRVLESAASANDEDVVKAYRRQLSRHHPDKLKANGLPDSMIEHAKERTQQIIEAYELIRTQRGL
jgi:DnaJ like chaperone protein